MIASPLARALTPDPIHEWIVVFHPTTAAWWGRFLAPGFGHCFAMAYLPEARRWLYVDPLFCRVTIGLMTPEQALTVFRAARGGEMRALIARPEDAMVYRPRWCVTCAGCVASLLGLRRYPLTPLGLFRALRRAGARAIGQDGDGTTLAMEMAR